MRRLFFIGVLIGIGIFLCGHNQAQALVIAHSEAHISNFQVSAAGTVNWGFDPWSAYASAYAFDSISGNAWDENWNSEVSASASTTYASAAGQASGSFLTADSQADINIPNGVVAQADADGYGDLWNTFYVTGGTGDVDVAFSLDFSAWLYGEADELGYFESDYIVGMYLTDWVSDWYLDSFDEISGTNITISNSYGDTLSDTITLQYNVDYDIILYADSEVYGHNVPEPATLLLFGSGLIGLSGFWGRKRFKKQG